MTTPRPKPGARRSRPRIRTRLHARATRSNSHGEAAYPSRKQEQRAGLGCRYRKCLREASDGDSAADYVGVVVVGGPSEGYAWVAKRDRARTTAIIDD